MKGEGPRDVREEMKEEEEIEAGVRLISSLLFSIKRLTDTNYLTQRQAQSAELHMKEDMCCNRVGRLRAEGPLGRLALRHSRPHRLKSSPDKMIGRGINAPFRLARTRRLRNDCLSAVAMPWQRGPPWPNPQ